MRRKIIALSLAVLLVVCLTLAFAVPALAQGHSDFGQMVAEEAQTQVAPGDVADYAVKNHPPTGGP